MNSFIKWIWEARNIDQKDKRAQRKHYEKFSKFMNNIKHTSPGFQDLWDISDFLNIIEYTYFYNNTRESKFWSDGNIAIGKTRFTIINNDIEIICTLNEVDQHIIISVKRIDTNSKIAELEFKLGQWASYKTEYDDILLDNIISIIWDEFYDLIFKYYIQYSKYCKDLERERWYVL